ncbi:Lrp/AsnC family transcriptional regulator [Phytomonospora sp. NPDC050363]|uniref:Lrp/AsnC family transcriptional regulator n=1 Tax=Phytomonospora sp. NPDC050363 TaxID=3155642 RepID=UPI0033D2B404
MSETVALDTVDLRILRQLQNNARITNRELAAGVHIAPSTCLDRIRRLRDAGVITGYTVRLDPGSLGRPLQAFLAVRVTPHRRPLVAEFVTHARSLPEVRAVFHLAGPDDFLVHVAVPGVGDLQRLVLDEFTARPEVSLVHTNLIFEQWDGPPLLPPGA